MATAKKEEKQTKTEKQPEKKTTTSTTVTTKSSCKTSYYGIINVLSYIAVCIGGLALFISMILSKCGVSAPIVNQIEAVANSLGWLILSVLSFNYIKRRRKVWMWVVWTIAVVMIISGIVILAI